MSTRRRITSIFKRRSSNEDPAPETETSPSEVGQISVPQPQATPAAEKSAETEKMAQQISKIDDGLNKMESSVVQAISANTTELKDALTGLVQRLDDVVLSVKSATSDKSSPFNSAVLVQELSHPEPFEEKKEKTESLGGGSKSQEKALQQQVKAESSEDEVVEEDEAPPLPPRKRKIQEPREQVEEDPPRPKLQAEPLRDRSLQMSLHGVDLKKFVSACALLEIVDNSQKRINALYEIGLISDDDLEFAGRVDELLSRFSPHLRPKDLALIACQIDGMHVADQQTRKVLAVAASVNKAG